MANPAELLLSVFEKWGNNAQNHHSTRDTRGDDEWLMEHRQCVKYLDQIEEILASMERSGKRVNTFKRQFPTWVQYTFNYRSNWNAPDPGIDDHPRDILENLIDAANEFVPALEEDKFEELKKYLDTVQETLRKDTSLSQAVKDATGVMIENIRTLIDAYTVVGDFELDRALKTLLGSLAFVSAQSRHRDWWKKVLDDFVFPYTVNQAPGIDSPPLSELASIMSSGG